MYGSLETYALVTGVDSSIVLDAFALSLLNCSRAVAKMKNVIRRRAQTDMCLIPKRVIFIVQAVNVMILQAWTP